MSELLIECICDHNKDVKYKDIKCNYYYYHIVSNIEYPACSLLELRAIMDRNNPNYTSFSVSFKENDCRKLKCMSMIELEKQKLIKQANAMINKLSSNFNLYSEI